MVVLRALSWFLVMIIAVGALASDAEAQRRRRRRRRPPEPAPAAEEQSAEEGLSPDEEMAQAAEGGEPGQAVPSEEEDAGEASTPEPVEEAASDDSLAFGPDLAPLRSEFTSIMDELVQLRSRTAVLGRQLFNTRVVVSVENRASDDNTLERIVLTLDGAPVFQGAAGDISEDAREVFDGFAAPGPHLLGVEFEQRQRADNDFRYTMRDAYRIRIERDFSTEILIILEDDSNIGEDFEDDGEGVFDVRTRLRVATREVSGGDE